MTVEMCSLISGRGFLGLPQIGVSTHAKSDSEPSAVSSGKDGVEGDEEERKHTQRTRPACNFHAMLARLVATVWASKNVMVCGIRKQPGFFRQSCQTVISSCAEAQKMIIMERRGTREECEGDIPKVYRLG